MKSHYELQHRGDKSIHVLGFLYHYFRVWHRGIHLRLWSSSVRTMRPFWVIPNGFDVRGLPDVG